MRPATVRRLLVFGVCALAVGGLYLVPSLAGSPDRVITGSSPEPSADPDPTPSSAVVRVSTSAGRGAAPTSSPTKKAPASSAPVGSDTDLFQRGRRSPTPSHSPAGATAYDPADERDLTAPTAVSSVSVAEVSHERLTVRWAAARDNVGVTAYRIWLNGFEVATTEQLVVTVPWFNDDSSQQVVQIRALDAAGNQGDTSPAVLAGRPSAEPTATPTPQPTETPSPTPSATETPSPSASPSPTPDATESTDAGNL
jgi:hypothetical protein